MELQDLKLTKREDGVAFVTLDRPEKRNAFDDRLIRQLAEAFTACQADPQVKVLVLQAAGSHFSAGADLAWMRRMADASFDANKSDALELARLMRTLNDFSKPTIARVQGSAFGGALGLIACCDVAVASDGAQFCLSEVKLGLAPAVISPYLVHAIGARACRRYFLTAEVFSAQTALALGLLHEVCPDEQLDQLVERFIQQLCRNGVQAMQASKQLIRNAQDRPLTDALVQETAETIARLRISEEGQEGLSAFFEKRKPSWT